MAMAANASLISTLSMSLAATRSAEGDLDAEMVAIAGAIIRQRTGHFDPSTYRDRYQEALQQLIEAKTKGLTIKPRAVSPR
jgi:DNA end-binding protein Ku